MSVKTKQCITLEQNIIITPRNAVAFIIIHPQISKQVTAKFILMPPASILVGEWLQRQRHFWALSLFVRSKWDVRHRLHCLVLTDTYLFNLSKGNQSKIAPYYVFATSMLWRRLLPLVYHGTGWINVDQVYLNRNNPHIVSLRIRVLKCIALSHRLFLSFLFKCMCF